MPFGAEMLPGCGVEFRLWAPNAQRVDLRLEHSGGHSLIAMDSEPGGWFRTAVDTAAHGALYRFRIDGGHLVTDPAARYQPNDVHGPSCVIDPCAFKWHDTDWLGRPWEEAVLYELHVGTFTAAGDYANAAARLDYLAQLGITAVELMPVGDFPGRWNWGYDGVLPFAPDSRYGEPDDLKAFVQAAHAAGIMVIMDVVYNHFGPEGNYLHLYANGFFTDRYQTPWGAAINYDGEQSAMVRKYFIDNALYWLEEFNVDGLRLDAVHAIFDASAPDILTELAQAVRDHAPPDRHVHLLLENDDNAARYLRRDSAGATLNFTAQWNDDWHHTWHVLLTGETFGYYQDYADRPRALIERCLREGFAYQGERSKYRGGTPRGELSADLPSTAFIAFLQNHDQIGNRPHGDRLAQLATPESLTAAVAVQLLSPSIPALFMGEEFGCLQPFLFFTDFDGELGAAVREGRRREFEDSGVMSAADNGGLPDPNDASSFADSVLDWEKAEHHEHAEWLALYRSLLALRHRMIVPRLRGTFAEPAGAVFMDPFGLIARWRMGDSSRLQLVANLSDDPHRLDYDVGAHTDRTDFYLSDTNVLLVNGCELPPWFVGWSIGPMQ